jgi:hypothetical protein
MASLRKLFVVGLAVFTSAIALAQDRGFSKDDRITPERLGLGLSSHSFSGGSCDGSNDPADTGQKEGDTAPVGVLPKESVPQSCPQPCGEQGHVDDSGNHRHDHFFLARDQSPRLPLLAGASAGVARPAGSGLPPVRACISQLTGGRILPECSG